MEKIKVLMVGNDPSVKGGITSVIQQLLEYDWSKVGIDMEFIPTYIDTSTYKKIIYFAKAFFKIKKHIKRNKPDIVYIHMSYKGSFSRANFIQKLCKKNNIRTIVHLHGSEFKKWYDAVDEAKKKKIRMFMRDSDSFIVLGEKWENIVKNIESETKTVVVGNTVHIPKESVEWNEPFRILFLGVLIKRKGVNDLLDAIAMINSSANIECLIAGSGEEEENLKRKSQQLKLENKVKFKGWINSEEKKRLLEKCQILVLPSYNEGLPVAILEAISYGMPVIATDVGDISSAVINESNGYLFEPGNIKKMANDIYNLSINKELYMVMSKKSKEIAKKYFSDTFYFNELLKLFKDTKRS